MNRKSLILMPLAVAALAAGMWLAQARYAPQPPAAPVAAEFWSLRFPDVTGQPQAMNQWRGRVVVLNFWASWCAPCREEMPDFAGLRDEYHAKGVEFVGIAIDSPGRVASFLRDYPVSYPILIGEGAATNLAERLGNPSGALPYTIVLDRDGRVVMHHLGRLHRGALDAVLRKFAT
ncbi:MAG: TlpA family protein disulfide reductase [Pseudomonadota bacterium]